MDTIMKRISLAKRSASAFSALALAATMVPLAGAIPGAEVEQAYAAATPGKQMNITAPMSIEFGSSASRISADASNATTTFKLQNKGEIGMAVSELNYLAPNKWKEANNFILKAKDEGQPLGLDKDTDPTLFTMWEGNGANPGDATKTMKFDFATVGDKSIKWGSGVPNTIDTMIDVQPSNEQTCTLYMDLASSNAKLNTNAAVSNSYTSLGSVKFTFSECSTVGDLTGLNTEQLKTQDFYLKDTRSDATITKDQVFSLDQVSRASASISKYQYANGDGNVVSNSPYYGWYKALLQSDIDEHKDAADYEKRVNPTSGYECRTHWGSHSKNLADNPNVAPYHPANRDYATYDVRIIGLLHDDKANVTAGAKSNNENDLKEGSKAGITFQFVYIMDEGDAAAWTYGKALYGPFRSWGYRFNYSDNVNEGSAENWSVNDGSTNTNYSGWADSELRERMNQTYSVAKEGLAKTYREKYSANYDVWTPERNTGIANKEKTIYDLAPAALTEKMVPVVKKTAQFTGECTSTTSVEGENTVTTNKQEGQLTYTSDKMFLASYVEFSGDTGGVGEKDSTTTKWDYNKALLSGSDGSQYEYYQSIGIAPTSANVNLTKVYQWQVDKNILAPTVDGNGPVRDGVGGGSRKDGLWNTRSLYPGTTFKIIQIGAGGYFGWNYVGNGMGVCPCFCL
ncbi:hypothetical protein [Adlercreutzia sp. ZJ304]|uniref:hypothetical protein n=1 Tax=Adlercreutzia sp. ZJ304 TaxID=2709791 RepID=UPI0013EAD4C1|nr:hypothetical protein [Adlercreutzia sp. ZJ304]